jgi:DNA mismatch repair protein MutS2
LSYIEPTININLNKQLDKLLMEESNELFKILQDITLQLRGEKRNLKAFERLLTRFDLFNGKVRFAQDYKGIIPRTNVKSNMYWHKAYHPILLIKNTALGLSTIAQDFELNQKQRFLVISGPNAGGKSITFKNSRTPSGYVSKWPFSSC